MSKDTSTIVIASAARTPVGSFNVRKVTCARSSTARRSSRRATSPMPAPDGSYVAPSWRARTTDTQRGPSPDHTDPSHDPILTG